MKELLRRWFGASSTPGMRVPRAVAQWASAHGWRAAEARGGSGFAIDASDGLRIEWGEPQREYTAPAELRIRAELGAGGHSLQMLVVTRTLMRLLEASVFEQATEDNRTRVDDSTIPEEMRWLVLYPKLARAELGTLAERVGALANQSGAAAAWLDAPLRSALEAALPKLAVHEPLVLVVQRGRFVLRRALAEPDVAAIESALALAQAAVASARAVAQHYAKAPGSSDAGSGWNSTG